MGLLTTGKRSFIDGAEHLGFTYRKMRDQDPEATLTSLIEEEYSRERVEAALSGTSDLLTPVQFRRAHSNSYAHIYRPGRNDHVPPFPDRLRALHTDLFHDSIFPDLYAFATRKTEHVNEEALRRTLLDRFYQGLSLGHSMKDGTPEEHALFNAIQTIAHRRMREEATREQGTTLFASKKQPASFADTISRLTGLHPSYISQRNSSVVDDLGDLAELYTKFLLLWTRVVDASGNFYQNGFSHFFPTPLHDISPGAQGRVTLAAYDRKGKLVRNYQVHPDLRVDDWAVEVKCGAAFFHQQRIDELVAKYSPSSPL
ncbi:MAG: hypothetical protein AABX72_03480, partial [Nanoarchaeota archaeon]